MDKKIQRINVVIDKLVGKDVLPTKTKIMQYTGWLKGPTQDILDYMVDQDQLTKVRVERSYKEAYYYERI